MISNNCVVKKKLFPAEKQYKSGTLKFGLQKNSVFIWMNLSRSVLKTTEVHFFNLVFATNLIPISLQLEGVNL